MARPSLDTELAAKALIDALLSSDRESAKKHGISERSIQRYRQQLGRPELAEVVAQKLSELADEDDWATESSAAIRSCLDFIKRSAEGLDSTAENVTAMSNALAVVLHYEFSFKLLECRLSLISRSGQYASC